MKGLLAVLTGGGNTGVAVGLPAGQNMVEGTEASIMVGAASANAGRRKAWVAAVAGLATLVPFLAGLWFLYQYEPGQYIDYAIAVLIFFLGLREVREGLESKPKADRQRPLTLEGPLGLDPTDPAQLERFQADHGLEPDGVLGSHTRGAIHAELHRRGERPVPNRLGVDVTDEESVRAFQRRVALEPDGTVGPRTQGALAAEASVRSPDPADDASVRRFQRQFRLPETGVVDARTQGALQAVQLEHNGNGQGSATRTRKRRAGGSGHDGDGAAVPTRPDMGPRAVYGFDLTSGQEVRQFQRGHGLEPTGVVDARTQGALRAVVERRHHASELDPTDDGAVRRFQEARGLQATGIVDRPTQAAIHTQRDRSGATAVDDRTVLGIDPTDRESIERFQALHDIDRTGDIDEETQKELRRTEEWTAGVDLTDPAAVASFQVAHGLEETGEVDAETQGVLRLYRTALRWRHEAPEAADGDGAVDKDGWYPLDPTDPDSISAFQRQHGIAETGTIGAATQSVLRAAVTERTDEAVRRAAAKVREAEQKSERPGILGAIRQAWPAYVGVVVEGGEAGLFTIGIAHGTGTYVGAAIAGGGAFTAPWVAFAFLRDWIESWPNWLFELVIGIILASAATIFGLFRATGIFGG